MSFRYKLLPWLIFVAVSCIISALGGIFLPYMLSALFWLLGERPLLWPTLDLAFKFGKLGLMLGFVTGVSICWVAEGNRKKHGIQEPKQQRRDGTLGGRDPGRASYTVQRETMLRDKLLPCLLYVVCASVGGALVLMLVPYMFEAGFWLLSFGAKSPSWPTFDFVFNAGKTGLIAGFICGIIDTWLSHRKKHGIQEPDRPRRW
jgi:hypothetical protein